MATGSVDSVVERVRSFSSVIRGVKSGAGVTGTMCAVSGPCACERIEAAHSMLFMRVHLIVHRVRGHGCVCAEHMRNIHAKQSASCALHVSVLCVAFLCASVGGPAGNVCHNHAPTAEEAARVPLCVCRAGKPDGATTQLVQETIDILSTYVDFEEVV